MSFFKYFPVRQYLYDGENRKSVVDILRRVALREGLKSNGDLFVKYRMNDAERIWNIAERVYDRADYHWIIWLMNDIVNPYTDMPRNQEELTEYIDRNYTGYSLYFDVREYGGTFQVGETVSDGSGYTAVVTKWNPTFRELVVETESGSSALTTRLNNSETITITGATSTATGTLKRRVQHKFAVAYFEDPDTKQVLSPIPPSDLQVSGFSYPLEQYVSGSQSQTVTAVTNIENEERLNDAKRELKILRPEYVDQVIEELTRAFRR